MKMREIPIFVKSQYLENHMGRALVHFLTESVSEYGVYPIHRDQALPYPVNLDRI